ncbi:MAG: hypothetical protein ACMUJM_17000 [bacterium]
MEEKYLQELFRLTLVHKYFKDNIAGLFETEPTEDGQKTLNSYGLYFKPKKDGFVIVTDYIQQSLPDLLELKNQFDNRVKLSFVIFTNDKHFFDYSELPYDPPGEYVYYFNNLNEEERKTYLLLEKKGIKESERVRIHTKKFSGDLQQKDDKIMLPQVLDCRGNEIPAAEYDLEIDERREKYYIDLARKEDGIYTIHYDTESITYYCAKASFIRRIPLIILELFVDTDVPEKYQIIKRINEIQFIDSKQFRLHFGIYSLYWRYKIIPLHGCHHTWIKIKTNNNNYSFTPEKVCIDKAQEPVIFSSDQIIDTPNDELEIYLYRIVFDKKCRLNNKYYYCNENYGIEIDGNFMCRAYDSENGKKIYKHKCPACCEDHLIGPLPKPDEIATKYYYEDEKYYAEMTLYLVKEKGEYLIKEQV